MKIRKFSLIVLILSIISFLNLNAKVNKNNIKELTSQPAIAEMNLTYRYVDNGNFLEIYDEDGKMLFRDKSEIPEPAIVASTMKVKIVSKNGKKIPVVEQFFPNGKIRSIVEYNLNVKDKDIEKNDIRTFYISEKLKDNIYSSITTETYYENGKLRTKAKIVGNKMKVLGFYENGNIFNEINLVDNAAEGMAKSYYPDGTLQGRMEFKAGLANGIYEKYYENGKLLEKATMKNGLPDGKYEFYTPDGKLEGSIFYKNGEVVGK